MFAIKINQESLKKVSKDIESYAKKLRSKSEEFCNKLLDVGISVCEQNAVDVNGAYGTHQMGSLVTFKKEIQNEDGSVHSLIIGTGQSFEAFWYTYGGVQVSRTVNPLLMIEFGTAAKAVGGSEAFNEENHKGELSTGGHDNDTDWWIAEEVDENGNVTKWKKGTAITPTQPMYKAFLKMKEEVVKVAKEVFR